MPEVAHRTAVAPNARSAERWLRDLLAEARGAGDRRGVFLVVPTNLLGRHLVRSLALDPAGGGLAWNVRAMTLSDLAAEVVRADPRLGAPLPPGGDLLLVRRAIAERLGASCFGDLARRRSPGLPRALLATIEDLRSAFVSPSEIRAHAGAAGPGRAKWSAIADALDAYEAALAEGGLLDRVGVVRAAARAAGASPTLREAAGVLLCGLHEATAAERALLRALRPSIRGAFVVGDPGLPAPGAAGETGRWDRASFDLRRFLADPDGGLGIAEEAAAEVDDGLPAPLGAFADRLLGGGGGAPLGRGDDGPVRLVSAPSETAEIGEALRAALEADDVRSVGLLARDRAAYAEAARDAAAAAGIPLYVRGGFPLSSTAEGQAALALLGLLEAEGAERLGRRAVVRLAETAPVAPEACGDSPPESVDPGLWDLLSSEALVTAGRPSWEERLTRLERRLGRRAEEEDRDAGERAEARLRLAAARALRRYVGRLDEALEAVRRPGGEGAADATWGARAGALAAAVRSLVAADRIIYGGGGNDDRRAAPNDRREEVAEALESLAALDRLPGRRACALDEFVAAARDAIEGASTRDLDGAAPFGAAGVLFGDLPGARFLPFDAVAVLGAAERAFPRPAAEDPILPDWERRAFQRRRPAGAAPITLRRAKADFDAYLLGAAVRSARRLFLLSCPRLDPATGRERIPSVYFLRAWKALRGLDVLPDHREVRGDPAVNLPASPRLHAARLAPPPGGAAADATRGRTAVSVAEADLAAVLALSPDDRPALLAEVSPHAAASVAADSARRRSAYGPYDGIVPPAAAAPARPLSPSAVDAWLRCPYLYLAGRRLGLAPLEAPEEALAVEPAARGTIFHAAAAAAGAALLDEAARRRVAFDRAFAASPEARVVARAAAERAVDAAAAEEVVGHPAVWAAERREILDALDRLLEAGFALEEGFSPPAAEFLERRVAFDLDVEGAGRVPFRGTIDRIDVEGGRTRRTAAPRALVRDYKTGAAKPVRTWRDADLEKGRDPVAASAGAQIPLYLEALRALGLTPVRGALVFPYEAGAGGPKTVSWPETDAPPPGAAAALLGPAVRSILGGSLFPVPGDVCRNCDFTALCGPRRGRIHEGKDPAFRRAVGGLEAIERAAAAAEAAPESDEAAPRRPTAARRRRKKT